MKPGTSSSRPGVDAGAHRALRGRDAAEERALARPDRAGAECGMTHGGVRWKTCSRATSGWIAGTIWIADAPVPITATRSPRRSWSWSQRAEWNVAPPNVPSPAIWGRCGSVSEPGAATSTRAESGPAEVSSAQRPASSSQSAPVTLVPNRIERRRSRSSRDALEVGADLRLRRVGPAPVRVRGERERVEVRGDVAGAAGVGVRPPGAADVGVALEDHEVVDALLAQPDGEAEAGEPGADDRDVDCAHCRDDTRPRRAPRASGRRSGRARSSRSGAGPARRG